MLIQKKSDTPQREMSGFFFVFKKIHNYLFFTYKCVYLLLYKKIYIYCLTKNGKS